MKKFLIHALVLVLTLSLLTACGGTGNDDDVSNSTNTIGKTTSAGENNSNNGDNSSSNTLEYDPLYKFTDYIAEQYAPFESAINDYIHANPDDSASGSLVTDATACVMFSTIDLGTYGKLPVTKQESGNVTTWVVSGESETAFGVKRSLEVTVTLDKNTNTFTAEETDKDADGVVTGRKVAECVVLPDETVLTGYYSYSVNSSPPSIYTSANIYKFNAQTGELIAYVGEIKDAKDDFASPGLIAGAKDLDSTAYNAFANHTATYMISDGKVETK